MIIDIHDVGHGACAVASFPTGARIMIDAGQRWDPFWAPSIEYLGQPTDLLVLSNLDEDHVENLPYVLRNVPLKALYSNPTINDAALAWMKREDGMRAGVAAARDLIQRCGPVCGPLPNLGAGWAWAYWNCYGSDFVDTNNLSVPVFIGYGSFTILFSGDLETAGWRHLLRSSYFRAHLARVNVFVASHHGRDNGCCEEVFYFCKPDVVVISDYEHQHLSQQTTAWYRERVKGIPDRTVPQSIFQPTPTRSVVTTRNDGSLKIHVDENGQYTIIPERFHRPALQPGLSRLLENPLLIATPRAGF
jgi:beta-lactamase superfamily II metal-dependent hydrolase